MLATINYMTIYFQEVRGDKAVVSGAKLAGFVFGFTVMSRFSGKILMKTRKSNLVMSLSSALLALGLGLCTLLTPTINYGFIFLFHLIMGIGTGFLIPATGAIIQLSVPQKDIAVAMANFSFDSYIGGCIGITVAGTIFNRTFTRDLVLGLSNVEAISHGVSNVLLYCVPPLGIAIILGLFLDPVKKRKQKPVVEKDGPQQNTVSAVVTHSGNNVKEIEAQVVKEEGIELQAVKEEGIELQPGLTSSGSNQ